MNPKLSCFFVHRDTAMQHLNLLDENRAKAMMKGI